METKIPHQNTDITMRAMAQHLKNKDLSIFGLKTATIKDLNPTSLPAIEAKDRSTDVIFLLEDDTLLHLEFQTTKSIEDLKRFMLYDARLAILQDRKINTAVIYSGSIKTAPRRLNTGSLKYTVTNVYMKTFNGDRELATIANKLEHQQQLDETDYLKLIFLPLMKSKNTEEEQTIKAAELAKNEAIPDKTRNFIIAALIVITDKFMTENNKRKLLEVIKLTQIEQWLREEGRQEGREEEKKEIALAALKKGLPVEDIIDITGLDKKTILKLKEKQLN